jgi:archaellum biogenesis ATPase FlaH
MTDTLDLIMQGIAAMFVETDIVEVRVPKAGKYKKDTISGYFRVGDGQAIAEALQELSGTCDGVYVTLNPCKPALLARTDNQLDYKASITTSDHDIEQRVHLLVDIDPVRPAGISASDEEIAKSREVTVGVFKHLKALGWATPLTAKSGNGFHLIYNIDLPNDKESAELVSAVLKTLAARFDTEFAKIDTAVFNAARIVKAYGTLAAKGVDMDDRPHRVAEVTSFSDGTVTVEQLKAFAATNIAASTPGDAPAFTGTDNKRAITPEKIEAFLEHHGIAHSEQIGNKWILTDGCPFNPDHIGTGDKIAAVFLPDDGIAGFHCFHASCSNNGWKEFRAQVEKSSGKEKFYFSPRSLIIGVPQTEVLTPVVQKWKTFEEIEPEELLWLWPEKLPLGANTIIAGDPSLGKTLMMIDLAARGSVGADFIDGVVNDTGVFETILFSDEDDPRTVIGPRLMGMHADRSKIHVLEMVAERNDQERSFRLDKDLLILRERLEECPGVRLIIIDPLSNYYGAKSGNNEQEVRSVLMPLSKLAQEFNVAIVTVMHNSKTQGRSAMHKTIGAVGNAGVARMGWTFIRDPENPDHKLMLQMKENLGQFPGIKYTTKTVMVPIKGKDVGVAGVEFLGTSSARIENILIQTEDFKEKSVQPAINFLKARMTQGGAPQAAAPLLEQAGAQGITPGQLKAARSKMGMVDVQAGNCKKWLWPSPEDTEGSTNGQGS